MATFIKNGFSIGPDASVMIQYEQTGLVIPAQALGHLIEISAEQMTEPIKLEPITDGGRPVIENIFVGWSGEMTFARVNGLLTGLFSAVEQNFFNGIRTHFNIQVEVNNLDGTVDSYLFEAGVLTRPGFGRFRMREAVEQRIGFEMRTMIVTAGPGSLIPLAA